MVFSIRKLMLVPVFTVNEDIVFHDNINICTKKFINSLNLGQR